MAESIISAAIDFSFEDERKKVIENRFEGTALHVDKVFLLRFSNIDSPKVKKLKSVWSIEEQVELKSEMNLPHFGIGMVKKRN